MYKSESIIQLNIPWKKLFPLAYLISSGKRIFIWNESKSVILLMSIAVLFLLIMTVLPAISIIGLPEDDSYNGDGFFPFNNSWDGWIVSPVYERVVVLNFGVSVFALYVVYLGGRSKHKRFNDRTIDKIDLLETESLKTALIRAVFNFLCSACPANEPSKHFARLFSNPQSKSKEVLP
jgi:hypothetical protein